MFDVIVIGAGPAGVTAAATAKKYGLDVLVLEANRIMSTLYSYGWKPVENFPGFEDMLARDLASTLERYALGNELEVKEGELIERVKLQNEIFTISTSKGEYSSKSIIIAVGSAGTPRKSGLKSQDARGVLYTVKDPKDFTGEKVIVVGGGYAAVGIARELARNGAFVHLIHRRDQFRASAKSVGEAVKVGVKVSVNTVVKEILTEKDVFKGVKLKNMVSGETVAEEADKLLFCIGFKPPRIDWIKEIGVEMNDSRIIVDLDMKTNVKGVFAAGDITTSVRRILVAMAQGYVAGLNAFKYLKKPYW